MKKTFMLEGLDCANCAAKIERSIKSLPGISDASVTFLTKKLWIETDESNMEKTLSTVFKIINKFERDIIIKEV
ncbi:MAG: heavy metal-associated domain-containing protein [Lachnospiraceae bacterium]|nr:heavy metal-associated domain-containing protein [Lachnospiraceae bacterium]